LGLVEKAQPDSYVRCTAFLGAQSI